MQSSDKKPGQSPKPIRKVQRRDSGVKIQLTLEELIKEGKNNEGLESPIDISFSILTEAALPPIEWVNFDESPKRMKISNSGTTAILSAKWHGPRPYLNKGPLPGWYVFSQLHFHWGTNAKEGSEHTMDGQAFPLEAHVMFFKNTYQTQEEAMKKTDGTVTIAYLFTLQEKDNEDIHFIISALKEIQNPLTSHHLDLLPFTKFLHVFTDDYFLYWGSVVDRSILWIICRKPLGISLRQLALFHSMMGTSGKQISKNFRSTKEINHRKVYHINPLRYRSLLLGLQTDRKSVQVKRTEMVVSQAEVQTSIGKGDETFMRRLSSLGCSSKNILERNELENYDIDMGMHTINVTEKKVSKCKHEPTNAVEEDCTDYSESLYSSRSNNPALELEARRKSQMKFQLATALLNLEKEEGNDYSILEKYLKTKFDLSQYEQCYLNSTEDAKQPGEMFLPSVQSLQMTYKFHESNDSSNNTAIKEKSKSDTHCLKGFKSSGVESDSEKNTVTGSNKSGWSSTNSILDGEGEPVNRHHSLPSRPQTSAAKMTGTSDEQEKKVDRTPHLYSSTNLKNKSEISLSRSACKAILSKKLSSDDSRKRVTPQTNAKPTGQTVDEARNRIRTSLRNSMSKLMKMRGKTSFDIMKERKTEQRPVWRY